MSPEAGRRFGGRAQHSPGIQIAERRSRFRHPQRFDSWSARSRRKTQNRDPRDVPRTRQPRRPTPRRLAWRCGGGSPTEDLFLNPLLDGIPGFELHRPGIYRVDPAADFGLPGRFGVRVRGAV
jgi:hypothetical protein